MSTFSDFRNEVIRLDRLTADPQPGLFTWHQMLAASVARLNDLYQSEPAAPSSPDPQPVSPDLGPKDAPTERAGGASPLRPRWFSEVEEGVRERARQHFKVGLKLTASAFGLVTSANNFAAREVSMQLCEDKVTVEHDDIFDRYRDVLALTYVETFAAEMRRRLEEAE